MPNKVSKERHLSAADAIVGTMMALLGLLGLFLASRALDNEIFVFGVSLALFAALFDFGLIKAHFDQKGEQP